MPGLARDPKKAGRRLPRWRPNISPWAIAAALIVVGMMFLGLGFWAFMLLAIGVVIEGVRASASDRVKEHFARKPDLSVEALVDGRATTEVVAGLPPYPFDLERLVANELVVLRRDGRAYARAAQNLARISPAAMGAFVSPIVRQPRKADYDKAWNDYVAGLDAYGWELREWLIDYERAADQRYRTFDLQLLVVSAPRGAFAERVRLEIILPVGVEIAGELPTVGVPPAAPEYMTPQPVDLNARLNAPWSVERRAPLSLRGWTAWRCLRRANRVGPLLTMDVKSSSNSATSTAAELWSSTLSYWCGYPVQAASSLDGNSSRRTDSGIRRAPLN